MVEIKNIPKDCQHCAYFRKHMLDNGNDYIYFCWLGAIEFPIPFIRQTEERASDCPLVEVKEHTNEKSDKVYFLGNIDEICIEIPKSNHEKLEKIKLIIKDYDTNCGLEEYMYLDMIRDVLTGADSYFKEEKNERLHE